MERPSEPGLYWARSWRCHWWNMIVCIDGEAPYLRIAGAFDVVSLKPVDMDSLATIGPMIEVPEKPVLSEGERKY